MGILKWGKYTNFVCVVGENAFGIRSLNYTGKLVEFGKTSDYCTEIYSPASIQLGILEASEVRGESNLYNYKLQMLCILLT